MASPLSAREAAPAPLLRDSSGHGLEIAVVSGAAALDLLDDDWDALVRRQALPNPTLSSAWLRRLASLSADSPLVVAARARGSLVAGAALQLHRAGGRLGPLVASWLGPAEQLCSPDLLVEPRRPDAGISVLEAILEHVQVIHVAAPASGPMARSLAHVAPWHRARSIGTRWVVTWPPTRHSYARRRAAAEIRWAARHGGTIETRVADEPDAIGVALAHLFRIHRDRWRGRDGLNPRFAASARHRAWNREVVGALASSGGVRIAEVLENGRPIAACLGFVEGAGGLAHTQAMRTDAILREPGHVALLRCLEALAEAGAEVVDLSVGGGRGGDPKSRIGAEPEAMLALLAAGSPPRQRSVEAAQRLVGVARRRRRG